MCWHKWSPWEESERQEQRIIVAGMLVKQSEIGKEYTKFIHEQRRHCLKCGKVQVEMIYH